MYRFTDCVCHVTRPYSAAKSVHYHAHSSGYDGSLLRAVSESMPVTACHIKCLTVHLTMQAGGDGLSSAIAVAAAAAAAGDAAPARLLMEHLEALAAAVPPPPQGLGSELGSNVHAAPAAGASADAARPGGAEPSAGGGSQGLVPAGDWAVQRAEAVQRLFELRLALGRLEEAAAGVLAATGALQRGGSYEARP